MFAPSDGAGGWSLGSRLALVAVALAVAYFLHRLAAVRVVADDAGVSVINIVHRRRLEWPEVVGVRLLRDDPWMMLDLSDGSAMAAMGVQKADGALRAGAGGAVRPDGCRAHPRPRRPLSQTLVAHLGHEVLTSTVIG